MAFCCLLAVFVLLCLALFVRVDNDNIACLVIDGLAVFVGHEHAVVAATVLDFESLCF